MVRLILAAFLGVITLIVSFLFVWDPGGYVEQPRGESYLVSGSAAPAPLILPPSMELGTGLTSWVDGSPIEDWPAEIAKREAAISAYLRDIDPANAAR
jgi:hypothetical protein